jgi:hypothetical protein
MKTLGIFTLLVALGSVVLAATNGDVSQEFLRNKAIGDGIDADHRLNEWRQTVETGTDRGEMVTIYRQNSTIVRIDLKIGLSNADIVDTFYYKNRQLIFVREKRLRYPYNEREGFDFDRPVIASKSEYYAVNGKLLSLITNAAHGDKESLMHDGEYLLRTVEAKKRIDGAKLGQ